MLGLSFSGVGFMSESKNNDHNAAAGASAQPVDRNPVSAVRLPADLTADIDAWAGVHAINRSEAIRRLIELGLKSAAAVNAMRVARPDAIAVEQLAVSQINRFIDPGTPEEERKRRIHRLTEGPPEFVDVRIDLPPKR
jgi:Arc/MetJ-type ribon-helix-helix transcriptional regulator